MSHRTGTIQVVSPSVTIGPDSGSPASSPNTWLLSFNPIPAPTGTKFVILHFTGAAFPDSNRLEVDLGYDTNAFTAADGPDFWTRPVKLSSAGTVTIRYITNGSGSGPVSRRISTQRMASAIQDSRDEAAANQLDSAR